MLPVRSISCRVLLATIAPMLALAACGDEDAVPDLAVDNSDPLMSAALADQIMVDPDMINRNNANLAASFPLQDGSIPQPDDGAAAIAAARSEALVMVGGRMAMRNAPPPQRVDGQLPPDAVLSVAARAASAGQGAQDCAAIAEFSAMWAARMPEVFPVYPRAAVQEAAGTDHGACKLRAVNFSTPVALSEVMDFYFTRATSSGFSTQRVVQDGDDILGGTSGPSSFMVFARSLPDGMTSVDLVTNGG